MSEARVERRIEFRMGINVDDIIIEDGDIFGDGVNNAARLEALRCAAPPSPKRPFAPLAGRQDLLVKH